MGFDELLRIIRPGNLTTNEIAQMLKINRTMNAKIFIVALFVATLFNVSSCKNDDDPCYGCDVSVPQLYKLRGDYVNNVCVLMDKNKTRIISIPSPGDPSGDTSYHPIQLINGYYLDYKCNYGVNSAYLEVKREKYSNWVDQVPADSFKYYLLDTDPYLEYYLATYKIPNDTISLDTFSLNNLIRKNEIEVFFDRMK